AATFLATAALLRALRALLASLFCCHAFLHFRRARSNVCPRSGTAFLQHIYCHLMSRVNTTCCCVARRCVHVRKNERWRPSPNPLGRTQIAVISRFEST